MRRVVWGAMVATLLAACGGDAPLPPRTPTPLDHSTTGTITGTVRVDGEPPAMAPIRFAGFAECAAAHAGPVPAGDLVVRDGKVEGAFVYVKDGLGSRVFAIPDEPVEMDQTGCLYRPRVVGAQVGQTIRFVNGDPLLHNVHGTPKASSGFNVSLARKGATRDLRLDHPEVMVSVRCDLHPWMQAWVGVVDHPYFAVTGADGAFTLRDVPPGAYTIGVWHERLGTREAQVTLAERGTADVAVTLAAPAAR